MQKRRGYHQSVHKIEKWEHLPVRRRPVSDFRKTYSASHIFGRLFFMWPPSTAQKPILHDFRGKKVTALKPNTSRTHNKICTPFREKKSLHLTPFQEEQEHNRKTNCFVRSIKFLVSGWVAWSNSGNRRRLTSVPAPQQSHVVFVPLTAVKGLLFQRMGMNCADAGWF